MREREKEREVGRWRVKLVKLREVKESQRVDETLGVRREGRKEDSKEGGRNVHRGTLRELWRK